MGALANAVQNTTKGVAIAALPPTAVSGLSMLATSQYGDLVWQGSLGASGTALLLAGACVRGRLPTGFSLGLGAFSLAALQAGAAGYAGLDWPTFYAWVLNTVVGGVSYAIYRYKSRHDSLDKRYKVGKIDVQQTRLAIAQMNLAAKLAESVPEPVVVYADAQAQVLDEAVFQAHGRRLQGVVTARTPYGWAAELAVPLGMGRDTFTRTWDKVATGVGAEGRFVLDNAPESNKVLVRCVGKDLLADNVIYAPIDVPFEKLPYSDPIRLGIDQFGELALMAMVESHTLIAGSSGNGKSTLMKLLALRVASLADSISFGVDMKPGAPELSMVAPLMQEIASEVHQVQALFAWLTAEIDRRGKIIAAAGVTKWNPVEHGGPMIYVFIDELAELVRQGGKEVAKQFESIMALTRAYGIRIIAATQQPSKDVFGGKTDAKGNFKNKICTRMETPAHYQFVDINPKDVVDVLNAPGKFVLVSAGHPRPLPCKAEYVSDEVCRAEVARLAPETVKQHTANRFVLPVPSGMNNRDAVRWALRNGPMGRREIEAATGLEERQVLRALDGPDTAQDGPGGAWALVGHENAA